MSFNTREHLVLIKGEPRTLSIHSYERREDGRVTVAFKGSNKKYTYSANNFQILSHPRVFDPNRYALRTLDGEIPKQWPDKRFFLALFQSRRGSYWYVECPGFANGLLFREEQVKLVDLHERKIDPKKNVFSYLTDVAKIDELKKDEDSDSLLARYYANIKSIPETRVVNAYLKNPDFSLTQKPELPLVGYIYPFGLNQSQQAAVEAAFNNRLSIIQGPPGTGKTQTILNILANLLLQNKTAMVVSNNNTATVNIKEKLQKYGLDFLVAFLGKSENIEKFIKEQDSIQWPSMGDWALTKEQELQSQKELIGANRVLNELFTKSEQLVRARQTLEGLKTEQTNFLKTFPAPSIVLSRRPWVREDEFPDFLMRFWTQKSLQGTENPSWLKQFFAKLHVYWKMSVSGGDIFQLPVNDLIRTLQHHFYRTKIQVLKAEIEGLEKALATIEPKKIYRTIETASLKLLKHAIHKHYAGLSRRVFEAVDLYRDPERFLQQFPIVLSTTFSSRSTLGRDACFDYVIMDEASQVPIVTGALALTCANNAVIVGDKRQLVNVVTDADRNALNKIFSLYELEEGYNAATNSFLDSVLKVIPEVQQTLLREHYRCSPRIINFCNKKFYGGDLLVMTEENASVKEPVFAIRTVVGNHARGFVNQREVDVLAQEVLPKLKNPNDLAVIAPYNNQVNAIQHYLGKHIDASTVHKYQGREKDTVVLSCVDNQVNQFNDDPHLINVAVSRAKMQFCLLVTGNELKPNSNLADLLDYIAYENGEIQESKVQSIFDYLYKLEVG